MFREFFEKEKGLEWEENVLSPKWFLFHSVKIKKVFCHSDLMTTCNFSDVPNEHFEQKGQKCENKILKFSHCVFISSLSWRLRWWSENAPSSVVHNFSLKQLLHGVKVNASSNDTIFELIELEFNCENDVADDDDDGSSRSSFRFSYAYCRENWKRSIFGLLKENVGPVHIGRLVPNHKNFPEKVIYREIELGIGLCSNQRHLPIFFIRHSLSIKLANVSF